MFCRQRLNGSLFGEVDEVGANTELDDEEEYIVKNEKKLRSDSSAEDSSQSSDSKSDCDSD